MKKHECIDAVAFAGVPSGSRMIKQDIAPGITLTEVTQENVGRTGPMMLADHLRTTLHMFLTDIPDDVELTSEHFGKVRDVLTTHYRLQVDSLLVGLEQDLSASIERDRDIKLRKLEELEAA